MLTHEFPDVVNSVMRSGVDLLNVLLQGEVCVHCDAKNCDVIVSGNQCVVEHDLWVVCDWSCSSACEVCVYCFLRLNDESIFVAPSVECCNVRL